MLDRVRVLVADDSAFMRHIISSQLQTDRSIHVVDTARDGQDALEKIRRLKPDVVTLDLEMPGLDGIATLSRAMVECPVPFIMLSSSTPEGARTTIRALAMGAVDFVSKPSGPIPVEVNAMRDELVAKVKRAAFTHVGPNTVVVPTATRSKQDKECLPKPLLKGQKVIVVGASIGGPNALQRFVPLLPPSLAAAVMIVAHLPAGLTRALASHLNDISQLCVDEVEPWEPLSPGTVFVVPGDLHAAIRISGRIELNQNPHINGARPAVDLALSTAAQIFGASCIAVILSGMGCDGVEGARAVSAAGGLVIVQDPFTCPAQGTPRAIIEAGIANRVVPLQALAEGIIEAVDSTPRGRGSRRSPVSA